MMCSVLRMALAHVFTIASASSHHYVMFCYASSAVALSQKCESETSDLWSMSSESDKCNGIVEVLYITVTFKVLYFNNNVHRGRHLHIALCSIDSEIGGQVTRIAIENDEIRSQTRIRNVRHGDALVPSVQIKARYKRVSVILIRRGVVVEAQTDRAVDEMSIIWEDRRVPLDQLLRADRPDCLCGGRCDVRPVGKEFATFGDGDEGCCRRSGESEGGKERGEELHRRRPSSRRE